MHIIYVSLFEVFQFISAAAVPFGLLNLGAALGRLQPTSFLPARIIGSIAFCRLFILATIGYLVVQGLVKSGFIDSQDKMLQFVLMV
jgi:auxin efflux carrier family protein